MYTTTQRNSGFHFQRTFSWRTGRPSPSEPPREVVMGNPPVRRTGENLGSYIRRRNEYYKTIASNLQSQPVYNGHCLVSDGGHTFHTLKVTAVRGKYRQWWPKWPAGGDNTGSTVPYLRLLKNDYDFVAFKSDRGFPSLTETGVAWPTLREDSDSVLNMLNSQVVGAVANMVPDRAEYGWGETIVELLKGNFPKLVPDLIKRAKRGAMLDPKATRKSLGSDYLNARFGIEPIVNDFIKTVQNLMSVHENLYDNYKRKRSTEITSSFLSENRTLLYRSGGTGTAEVQGISSFQSICATDAFLSAKYEKVRPSGQADTFYAQAQEFLRHIGFNERLTWDLLPWSWLVDWSGTIGSSIENAAAFNQYNGRFATSYSWVTRKSIYSAFGPSFDRTSGSGLYATREVGSAGSIVAEATQRYQVSPFGVGFTMPSLSLYQWSILVSLGLAKVK